MNTGGPGGSHSILTAKHKSELISAKEHLEEKIELWKTLREIIIQEDNLVNHRLTWLLTFQGFTFASFFLVQSAVFSNKLSLAAISASELFFILIFAGAIWLCKIVGDNISSAFRHNAAVKLIWLNRFPDEHWKDQRLPSNFFDWWIPKSAKAEKRQDEIEEQLKRVEGQQLPPIFGRLGVGPALGTERVPFVLFIIDGAAILACLIILATASYSTVWLQRKPPLQYRVLPISISTDQIRSTP